ncbi:unnamed protein product [Eruca vesicaria subsp. sativa]|uniref:Uncharacterized protein n=1 Tax=Eruca vesicaria subsp. sativa TaxID=29727 RepID=A0ABC8M9D8_ERUVS|nr:unnamed protein product [Eruca vesicaria subsp. sativa]
MLQLLFELWMGIQDTPPEVADHTIPATWGFLFLGLVGIFLLGLVIYECIKRRGRTSAQVTPGELELGNAAP